MGHSSLLGLEHAAVEPDGRDIAALGPGDNSDSGSDRVGLDDENTDDPVERHPAQRGVDVPGAGSRDIGVDRIFTPGGAVDDTDDADDADDAGDTNRADPSGGMPDEEDPDLAFIDSAAVGDPVEEEEQEDEGGGLGDEGDNIPGAHVTPLPIPPGRNPAPDVPENPGLPGDGDGEDLPADDDPDNPDAPSHRPGRASGGGGMVRS